MSLHPLDPEGVIRLPNDTEAEDQALAAILRNGVDHLRLVVGLGLTPERFYGIGRADLFRAMLALADSGRPIAPDTVIDELKARDKADKRNRATLLALLELPGSAHGGFAERVIAESERRRLLEALRDAAERVRAGGAFDPGTLTTGGATGSRLIDLDPSQEVPEPEYLIRPYLPKGARVWLVGPTGSGKSWLALWWAARLSNEGKRVLYLSQDNNTRTDTGRLATIRPEPDYSHLRVVRGRDRNIDLNTPEDRLAIRHACEGASLLVVDTLGKSWRGSENDNAEVNALDADFLAPLAESGTTVLVIHHPGHGDPEKGTRKGAGSARGAVSMGQGADTYLNIEKNGDTGFRIEHAKDREIVVHPGLWRPYDYTATEDGGLTLTEAPDAIKSVAAADAGVVAEVVREHGRIETRNALKAMLPGRGVPARRVDEALRYAEDTGQIVRTTERVETKRGNREVSVYTAAVPTLPTAPPRLNEEPGAN